MVELIVALFDRGGPVMVPILAVSFIAWSIIFFRLFDLSRKKRSLIAVFGKIGDEAERTSAPLDGAQSESAPFAETLRYILNGALSGKRVEQAVSRALELEKKKLSHLLPTLATLIVISPLLGLLGTVTGMIASFNTISLHGTGDPVLLGSGISEALITTEAGLVVAIPVLIMHNYLASKVDHIITDLRERTVKVVTLLLAIR
jgi:biopolymer transport protein ExbB